MVLAERSLVQTWKGAAMRKSVRTLTVALLGLALAGLSVRGEDLKKGKPDLKSAGPMTFGPDGLLFIGDPQGAAIFAIDTGDRGPANASGEVKVPNVNEKIAAALGSSEKQVIINDVAVNPASGQVYLSVSRGVGPQATPVIVRVERSGKIQPLALDDVKYAKVNLPNPPHEATPVATRADPRMEAITDLAYVDGRVFVAGLSNEEWSSRLLAIPYPFKEDTAESTKVEIYHGAHGRYETKAPVRTFVPYSIGGQPYLLASYTCTPLVKIPVNEIKPGSQVRGTTVAELGNRNRPLDMIVYQKGGKDYLLLANSDRGVMKITTDGVSDTPSIKEPVKGGGTKGLTYETIANLKGVVQLDRLDRDHAVVLRNDNGAMNLETIALP
jgi:hypothetical protein